MTKPSKPVSSHVYNRVMLKISGESLMGRLPYGIDPEMVGTVAQQVKDVVATGVEVCLVIGGGNIFRGMSGAAAGMERATGDYMGMLATVMNALAMQNALEQIDVPVRIQSALTISAVCELTHGTNRQGGLDANRNINLFKRILHGKRIHHCCQHAHIIASGTFHTSSGT